MLSQLQLPRKDEILNDKNVATSDPKDDMMPTYYSPNASILHILCGTGRKHFQGEKIKWLCMKSTKNRKENQKHEISIVHYYI